MNYAIPLNQNIHEFGVHSARFLKYVWPFYNIIHEQVKAFLSNCCQIAKFNKVILDPATVLNGIR